MSNQPGFSYCVVRVLESKDRFIAPHSWMSEFIDSINGRRRVVIYPKEDKYRLLERAKRKEPIQSEWSHYAARIEYRADTFADAESWLKANSKVSIDRRSPERGNDINNDLFNVDNRRTSTLNYLSRNRDASFTMPSDRLPPPDSRNMLSSQKRPPSLFDNNSDNREEKRKRSDVSAEAINHHKQASVPSTSRGNGRHSRDFASAFENKPALEVDVSSDEDTTYYHQKNKKSTNERSVEDDTNRARNDIETQHISHNPMQGTAPSGSTGLETSEKVLHQPVRGTAQSSFTTLEAAETFTYYPVRGTAPPGSTRLEASVKESQYPVRGTAPPGSTEWKASKNLTRLYLSYVKLGTSVSQVRDHLVSICGSDDCIVKIHRTGSGYLSFMLSVPSDLVNEVMAPNNWPKGITIKIWKENLYERRVNEKHF